MTSFRQAIFDLLREGQELSGAERLLVNRKVDEFLQRYETATGESPKPLFGTIYLIAPTLEEFGFKLPRVDRWRQEDQTAISHHAGTKSRNLRKER